MRHGTIGIGPGLLALALLAALATWPAGAQEPDEADTAVAEPPPRFESRAQRDRELLADSQPREARRLDTEDGEVLALYRPALGTQSKGTLLLLYTSTQVNDWPRSWENLRSALPYHGWATLALTLPPPPEIPVTPRPVPDTPLSPDEPEPDQNAPPPANPEPEPEALPRNQRIAARIEAVLALAAEEGQANLVMLADNLNATEALDYLGPRLELADEGEFEGQSPVAGPIRALILVNLHPHQPLTEEQLLGIFSVSELPLLDLFPGPGPNIEQRRRHHRGLAQRLNMAQYQGLVVSHGGTPLAEETGDFLVQRLQTFMTLQVRNPAPAQR